MSEDESPEPVENSDADVPMKTMKERGVRGVSGELWERMKTDPRFAPASADAIKDAKHRIKEALMIEDPKSGVRRIADLKNTEDVKVLALLNNIYVRGEKGSSSGDFIALKKDDLPKDANESGLFPLAPTFYLSELVSQRNTLDEITAVMPLINIPVYTSNLLLFLTGYPTYFISDSFSVFRMYLTTLKILHNADFTSSRPRTCLAWLKNRLQRNRLSVKDVEDFIANAVLHEKVPSGEPLDADYLKSLAIKTKEKKLKMADLEVLDGHLFDVKKYQSAWCAPHRIFREDVKDEQTETQMQLSDKVCEGFVKTSEIKDEEEKLKERLDLLYAATFEFLHLHEIAIMRLIQDAAIKKSLPQEHWTSMITKPQVVVEEHIAKETTKVVLDTRNGIARMRRKLLTGKEEGDFVCDSCSPTSRDLEELVQWVHIFDKEPDDLMEKIEILGEMVKSKNVMAITDGENED